MAVAELPERWTERTPERHSSFDLEPAFGRAEQVERLREEVAAAEAAHAVAAAEPGRSAPGREWGPFMTCLQMPWSYGDRGPGDFWHRVRCRVGRHEISGGHPMQLDGAVVFIERQCRWCGVVPA